jgi:negative regulator of genetic competence, sporulation and motility
MIKDLTTIVNQCDQINSTQSEGELEVREAPAPHGLENYVVEELEAVDDPRERQDRQELEERNQHTRQELEERRQEEEERKQQEHERQAPRGGRAAPPEGATRASWGDGACLANCRFVAGLSRY